MSRALWLPSWYPHKNSLYDGDFIERHAKAASLYISLQVIFIVKDNSLGFGKVEIEERKYFNDSAAWIYYFGSSQVFFIDYFFSFLFKLKLYSKGYTRFLSLYGKPSLLHVHVAVNNGLLAYWWSLKKNIPLIISEHWTGYLKEAASQWKHSAFFKKYFIQKIFSRALLFTAVSEHLANNIQTKIKKYPRHAIIPNTVDTGIFKLSAKKHKDNVTTFIHVSTLTPQKNFNEIIAACSKLKEQNFSFKLIVIGRNKEYENLVKERKLGVFISFKNEIPQELLSIEMQESDAIILYSLYETFGCVIIEANACGTPCLVSDIKTFDENVQQNITGLKMPLHNPEMLANAMIKIITKQISFDSKIIADFAQKHYSMEVVGKLFLEEYKKIILPVSSEVNSKKK